MFLLSRPVCVYVFVCTYAHTKSQSSFFAAPWTIVHQAPLSMEFFRQDYWSGLPFPPSGDLPGPRITPTPLASPALAGEFFTTSANLEALNSIEKASLFFLCTKSD